MNWQRGEESFCQELLFRWVGILVLSKASSLTCQFDPNTISPERSFGVLCYGKCRFMFHSPLIPSVVSDLCSLHQSQIDFVNPGLIGDYPTFKKVFEDPIVKSRMQNSRREVRETGEARTQQLAKITNQIILRRTADLLSAYLLPKLEFVVFCSPTILQIDIYKHILGSGLMRQVLNGVSSNPLVLIGHLRKLCNSPELLLRTVEEKNKPGAEDSVGKAMLGDVLKAYPKNRVACDPSLSGKFSLASLKFTITSHRLLTPSWSIPLTGKMMTLMSILRKTRETTQDKVVVCSVSFLTGLDGLCLLSTLIFSFVLIFLESWISELHSNFRHHRRSLQEVSL